MKTQEQIKTEVVNYLQKSSKHLFTIGSAEHRVILHGDFYIRITGNDVSVDIIDFYINHWDSNAKNVIKNDLFLIPRYYKKEIKTIPYYNNAKLLTNKILESISDKTDKKEIISIIKGML
jgi:hypothetical protein